jgi:hypothetical protein
MSCLGLLLASVGTTCVVFWRFLGGGWGAGLGECLEGGEGEGEGLGGDGGGSSASSLFPPFKSSSSGTSWTQGLAGLECFGSNLPPKSITSSSSEFITGFKGGEPTTGRIGSSTFCFRAGK